MPVSLVVLEDIIREAGNIALTHFKNVKNLQITRKSPRDLVTEADIAVEQFLKDKLSACYPQFGFWGEESGQSSDQLARWVVDPIDGTHSFSKGQYFWGISVALEINQDLILGAVYAPALDDYYCAEQGKGAWKNGQAITVSAETELGNAMIATAVLVLPHWIYVWLRTAKWMRFGSNRLICTILRQVL
jgi:myo-inositol-1(or 4)-monophosphatase